MPVTTVGRPIPPSPRLRRRPGSTLQVRICDGVRNRQAADQNSALPGVRGNGIASLIFPMPVTNNTKRSSPMP